MSSIVLAKFEVGQTVRVVTTDTPFFGWQGKVVSVEELELSTRHYLIRMIDWFIDQPLLFREMQLSHGYDDSEDD